MTTFGAELCRLMAEQSRGVRELAREIHFDPSYLSAVRTGRQRPSPDLAEALDAVLGAGGTLLAQMDQDLRPQDRGRDADPEDADPEGDDVERRAALRLLGAAGTGMVAPLEILRTGLRDRLAVTETLDDWELTAYQHAWGLRHRPLAALLADLAADIAELRDVLGRHQDEPAFQRVAAQFATLAAYSLGELGHSAAACRWWRTARQTAAVSGDRDLSVLVNAIQAVMLDWSSPVDQTIASRLARRTEHHAAGRPSAGLAQARLARAGVLAHTGREAEAHHALDELDELCPSLPADAAAAVGGFFFGWGHETLREQITYLRAELGNQSAITDMSRAPGNYRSGERWQAEARLQAARGMVRIGEIRLGLDQALTAYHALPPTQRGTTFTVLARRVATALPEAERTRPAARELLATTAPA